MKDLGHELWSALQPIIDADTGQVVGHEALLRGGPGTSWESPGALFAAATRLGYRDILEANARRLALQRLGDLPAHQFLFMNVDVLSLDIPTVVGVREVPSHRVALELSEQQPVLDNPLLLQQVDNWRAAGHPIALDDYGAGYMGPGAILTLRPDILKLDRAIIVDIDSDRWKQEVVKAVAALCHTLGIAVIAEGVETPGEFVALRQAGVRYAQGFLFGRPERRPRLEPVALPEHPLPAHRVVELPGRRRHDRVSEQAGG